jgi:hypothetical protein
MLRALPKVQVPVQQATGRQSTADQVVGTALVLAGLGITFAFVTFLLDGLAGHVGPYWWLPAIAFAAVASGALFAGALFIRRGLGR